MGVFHSPYSAQEQDLFRSIHRLVAKSSSRVAKVAQIDVWHLSTNFNL